MPAAEHPPAELETRARAAYVAGDLEAAIATWEQVYAERLSVGDAVGAAEAAAMVANSLLIDTGLMAPVRGWVRRAERLLEPYGETPLHAILDAIRAYERFMCGDLDAARQLADRAIELADRHGVVSASVIGQTARARLALLEGDFEGGLAQLEEVGARLMSGEVDSLIAGMMLCEIICAAQGLAMHDLAREWTDVMDTWCRDAAFGGFHGRCRVHRAELLRMSGPVEEAEEEALAACAELRPWMRREYGWPLVELGNIRLRRGDLLGAEKVFAEALEHAWSPQPGLALARFAQGDVSSAAAMLDQAITHPLAMPSKEQPPFGDLRLAPLLQAQAEVALATGDAALAAAAAERLADIATLYPSSSLATMATVTSARAALLDQRIDDALAQASAAVMAWAELGAPYESAEARILLGVVHVAAGRSAQARAEWTTARQTMESFGARGRVAEIDALLAGAARLPITVVPTTEAVFRVAGGLRTIGYDGLEVLMPDLKGYRYLERLLVAPGQEFHVVDLVTSCREDGQHAGAEQPGIPVLDDEARSAYRRRLADVEDDIEEARGNSDLARLELGERDRDYLIAELSSAVGLFGRDRTTGGSAERARTSVARALRYALARLAEQHPAAARHFERSVNTGSYCCYAPDPAAAAQWST